MGAFAMTSTQVLLTAGGYPKGILGWRRRSTNAALIEQVNDTASILVINSGTVAVPIWLPTLTDEHEQESAMCWFSRRGTMPSVYREIAIGKKVKSFYLSVTTYERDVAAANLKLLKLILENNRLALLALYPHDPHAIDLHITLFGVALVDVQKLQDYLQLVL